MTEHRTAHPSKPTTPPRVDPPAPAPTPDADLVNKVAELTKEVAELTRQNTESQARTAEAIGKLEIGLALAAFGKVGDSVDELTGALKSNMRFVREQQAVARRRQREAQEQLAGVVERGAPAPTVPTDDPNEG